MDVKFTDHTVESYEDQPVASGKQGTTYRSRDGRHAAKLFTFDPATTPAEIANRERQVDEIIGTYNAVRGDPLWAELFAWPDKRIIAPRPGVRMPFVDGLTRLDHYFYSNAFSRLSPEQQGWLVGRVAAGIKMSRAVARLADHGLCHSDLSEKNLLVDAFRGRATVIDCDSLVVPGIPSMKADVLGTPGYMAPELVTGEEVTPRTDTDRHALAVLLYRWLLFRHPLDGPLVHDPADAQNDDMLRLGARALYCEHPSDTSNRPAKMQLTAASLTPRLEWLFREAFVTQLRHPAQRPLPHDWEGALVEMLDRLIPCSNPTCTLRFFAASDVAELRCPLCGQWADIPYEIPILRLLNPFLDSSGAFQTQELDRFGHFIAGWQNRPIFPWHVGRDAKPTMDPAAGPPDVRPVAVVQYDDGQWYLNNIQLPDLQWDAGDDPEHPAWQAVALGSWLPLQDGMRVLLGQLGSARSIEVEMRQAYKTDE